MRFYQLISNQRWTYTSYTTKHHIKHAYQIINPYHNIRSRTFTTQSINPAVLAHRNIGIIAHIDAGKTTTTERLLYLAGAVHSLGDVDRGDTTTDFLEQERERGITIKSACVELEWNDCLIQLIDTPGHVDFTQEVECALAVLDGTCVLIDAVKGVQAQTIAVQRQATRYQLPSIAYVNKMDRQGADLHKAVRTIRQSINPHVALLQLPLIDNDRFIGVIDLIAMERITFADGAVHSHIPITSNDADYSSAQAARMSLLETLAEHDDHFCDLYLSSQGENNDTTNLISIPEIHAAIKRVTMTRTVLPVLCGASLSNVAVQPLLDAITRYLPNPIERIIHVNENITSKHNNKQPRRHISQHDSQSISNKQLSPTSSGPVTALAFKVTHDLDRTPLPIIYIRVYSGTLRVKDTVINASLSSRSVGDVSITSSMVRERVLKLLRLDGGSSVEVNELSVGEIGAIVGLKYVSAGDTLVTTGGVEHTLAGLTHQHEPVFHASVHAISSAGEADLNKALACLRREDPSIHITTDSTTGQCIIGCQGELHMEIIQHRLLHDFKAKADFGKLQVAFRETVIEPVDGAMYFTNMDGHDAAFSVRVQPAEPGTGVQIDIDDSIPFTGDEIRVLAADCNTHLSPSFSLTAKSVSLDVAFEKALHHAVETALGRGPLQQFALIDIHVTLSRHYLSSVSTPASVRACVSKLIRATLTSHAQNGGVSIVEPVMNMEVAVEKSDVGDVLNDLTSRKRGVVSEILALQDGDTKEEIHAQVPLVELVGYASELRSRTGGTGSFTMNYFCHRAVPQNIYNRVQAR